MSNSTRCRCIKRFCKCKKTARPNTQSGWPRKEFDGKHYNEDQYDVIPTDEHGEVPPTYRLRQDAVSIEDQQIVPQSSSNPVMMDVIDFLSALWNRAMRVAGGDEARAEVIQENILKLNGFPVGTIWPDAVLNAVRLGNGPVTGNGTDAQSLSDDEISPDPEFLDTFLQLQASGKLSAIAGKPGAPMNNAGLYQGRIEQIDPVKWQTVRVHPLADSHRDHDMTNLMYPSLNEEEGAQDSIPQKVHADPEPIEPDNPMKPATKAMPQVVVIVMTSQSSGPEKIEFFMDGEGELHISEAKGEVSDWWRNLSPNQKRRYLQTHPNSKYAKAYRKRLAQKKAANKRNAGKGKNAPKIVQDLEKEAQDSAQAIEESGVDAEDVFPEELDNEDDSRLDTMIAEMDKASQDEDGVGDEDDSGEDVIDEDGDGKPDPENPAVDSKAVKELQAASEKPGFFKSVVGAVKKRASAGTLGAMGRFVGGNMREGDSEKVVRGLSIAVGALALVGAGIGIAMIAGPGPLTGFVKMYVESMANQGGDGFNFSGEASSSGGEDSTEKKDDAPISDENIQKLTKGFIDWLSKKADEQEQAEQEESAE